MYGFHETPLSNPSTYVLLVSARTVGSITPPSITKIAMPVSNAFILCTFLTIYSPHSVIISLQLVDLAFIYTI